MTNGTGANIIYTVSFDYTGKPPTQSRMTTIINGTGFTSIETVSLLVYKIITSQSESTVELNVQKSVQENGDWETGHITSFEVT